MLLLHPPIPPRRPQASFPHTRPAAPPQTSTSNPEGSAAGDLGAGADGAGAKAPGGPGPPERADCPGTAVDSLPHPAAGGLLHRPARWEHTKPYTVVVCNAIEDLLIPGFKNKQKTIRQ